MRPRQSRPSRLIRNIDVSAFASILVVLLALFMFLTELPHHGVSADLPKVWHPVAMPGAKREDALIVFIMRDGSIYFGNHRIRPSDLPPQIRERVDRGAEKKIYIAADARARYVAVREVLDGVRSAGVERVAFLANQRRAEPSGLEPSTPLPTRPR